MRIQPIRTLVLGGRRVWELAGDVFVVEGMPLQVAGRDRAEAIAWLLRTRELVSAYGPENYAPAITTALERIRNADADPRLMRAVISSAIDGRLHGATLERAAARARWRRTGIVRLEHSPDRGPCPGCGGRYGKNHRARCPLDVQPTSVLESSTSVETEEDAPDAQHRRPAPLHG